MTEEEKRKMEARIWALRSQIQTAQHALRAVLTLLQGEHSHSRWLVGREPLFVLIRNILEDRGGGVNSWPIVLWEAERTIDLITLRRVVKGTLELLARIRQRVDEHHPEDAYRQRSLVEPSLGNIEIAIGNLRLSAAALSQLIDGEQVIWYKIPAPSMDGASC